MKTLPLSPLTAITPLDGRYFEKVADLSPYVSEYNLIRVRFEIEAKYLIALADVGIIRRLTAVEREKLTSFGQKLSLGDVTKVKKIEEDVRHDVKAAEKTFRQMLGRTSLKNLIEMIHFGLTSEDVNNLAYRLMLTRATDDVLLPLLDQLTYELVSRAEKFKTTPMLGRTHGQAAVPTTVGKEFMVFAIRLNRQVRKLDKLKLTGKLTGAVGNFNALQLAFPNIDWLKFSSKFVESFGFQPNLVTTQINPYEDMIEYFQNYQRINTVLIDLDQDLWRYISDDWFTQEVKKGEIGSSTMPQKVNPIDFENSEGNLTLANSIFESLSRKLGISRLQRDLSDSTVIRNVGSALGYSLVGYKSVLSGLSRIRPNLPKISQELDKDWAILSEGVQTILRKFGVEDPYSLVASLMRGEHINKQMWQNWVGGLPIAEGQKRSLRQLTPQKYLGLAVELVNVGLKEIKLSKKK